MKWRLFSTMSAPMPFHMALDECLFLHQKSFDQTPLLRFYFSSEPWISAGCSYRHFAQFENSAVVSEHPAVPVCRRMTGGGCVLHGNDLMFSLIARTRHDPERLESVRTSYGKIHESVKMGFSAMGIGLKSYGVQEDLPRGSDCFCFPVASDLSWQGTKVAGGAQKRSHGVLLHQESLVVPSGIEAQQLTKQIVRGFEMVFGAAFSCETWDPAIYFESLSRSSSYEFR